MSTYRILVEGHIVQPSYGPKINVSEALSYDEAQALLSRVVRGEEPHLLEDARGLVLQESENVFVILHDKRKLSGQAMSRISMMTEIGSAQL